MVDWSLFSAFLIAAVALVIVPGPDMLLIITLGSRWGRHAGVAAALGVSAGLLVHVVLAVAGLAALLHQFPAVYQILKWCGVFYLLYLALSSFRESRRNRDDKLDVVENGPDRGARLMAFRKAMLTNVMNPKVVLFNVAFFPQFVNPSVGSVAGQLAILGCILVVIDFAIDAPIGYFAGSIGSRFVSGTALRRRRVDRGAAVVFVALAGWLAWS